MHPSVLKNILLNRVLRKPLVQEQDSLPCPGLPSAIFPFERRSRARWRCLLLQHLRGQRWQAVVTGRCERACTALETTCVAVDVTKLVCCYKTGVTYDHPELNNNVASEWSAAIELLQLIV